MSPVPKTAIQRGTVYSAVWSWLGRQAGVKPEDHYSFIYLVKGNALHERFLLLNYLHTCGGCGWTKVLTRQQAADSLHY